MKRDKCGVCGGDSTTCDTVSKFFNEQVRYGRIPTSIVTLYTACPM